MTGLAMSRVYTFAASMEEREPHDWTGLQFIGTTSCMSWRTPRLWSSVGLTE